MGESGFKKFYFNKTNSQCKEVDLFLTSRFAYTANLLCLCLRTDINVTMSFHISRAVRCFYETELKIWAFLGQLCKYVV